MSSAHRRGFVEVLGVRGCRSHQAWFVLDHSKNQNDGESAHTSTGQCMIYGESPNNNNDMGEDLNRFRGKW